MKLCQFPQPLRKTADAAGMSVKRDTNGEFRILDKANRTLVAIAKDEVEVRNILRQLITNNGPNLHGNIGIPVNGVPQAQHINPMNSVFTPTREVIGAAKTGPLTWLTAPKQFAQHIENAGFGKAWSVVYEQSQKLKNAANTELARVKRAALGDKTFQEAFTALDKRVLKLTDKRMRENVSLYGEAYTKDEVAQLVKLSTQDKWASDKFVMLGQEHNIPELIRRNALIDDYLSNRDKFLTLDLPQLKNAILEQRLPAELMPNIENLAASAGQETTWQEVAQTMAVTQDEQDAMDLLRTMTSSSGTQAFNIPNVYRHATAPILQQGFKDGRVQFAALNKMTPEAIQIAKDRLTILDEGYSAFNIQHSRELTMGVQLPVFRNFIDAGLMPGKQFANSSGAAKLWADVLDNGMTEGSDIFTRRVLSGHLNPHELDPAISLSKHIRNLSLRDTLDPAMPGLLEEVKRISANDPRFGKIMYNYLQEIQGHPTEGMENLTKMIRSVGRFMGVGFDDRVADRMIESLNYLTYSASIPFRPALIARNFYQITMSLPIIGPKAWAQGIKTALGFEGNGIRKELADAAWERAYKAQALLPDVVPLHGGESFRETGGMLTSKLPATLSSMGYNVRESINWAFSKYRSADDLGRVIQFEAGRSRVNSYLGDYVRSNRTAKDLESFIVNSKVRTFNESVEGAFTQFIKAGQFDEAANLIGKELADKVHFLYGSANHPIGWGGPVGKLLGQFGTFPVQYLSHIGEGLTRGTVKDRVEFAAAHSAINMGIVAAGSELFDADLESWSFLPALHYTGGPYAEMVMSAAQMWGGSDAEKALAKKNLAMMMPWHIPSITLPGSYFFGDWAKAYNEEDTFGRILARGSGIRFMNPGQETYVQKGFGWVNELLP